MSSFREVKYMNQILSVTSKSTELMPLSQNPSPFPAHPRSKGCGLSSPQALAGVLMYSYWCSHWKTSEALDILLSCRRELSYFGVKVAIIEPGFFLTEITSSARLSSNIQMLWDHTSSEIREIYGEKYLASCKWALRAKATHSPECLATC